MAMTLFWACLNAVVIGGGFIGAIACLIIAINTITHAFQRKRNYLVAVVKAVICVAVIPVLIGCSVHFIQLPIFPDARERQRLVHEMKSIQSEMLKDEISENLYSRVVKYNDDNKKYGAKHRGCEVDVTFDTDVFNTFDIKSRIKSAYIDYKIYINGVEVPQDKITLSDYRNKTVRISDEKKEIYITT